MKTPMIDAQVHPYERDRQGQPWVGTLQGPGSVTGDDIVLAMGAVGVDGALLVSPWSMYRFDASYALEVHARHPGRFGLIKPFDPRKDSVAEEVADWASQPGAVGARVMIMEQTTPTAEDPGVNRVFDACAEHGLPVNVLCWGNLPLLAELAGKHPNTQIVLDHLGLRQPFEPPVPAEPFSELAGVLDLAQLDNIAIKISGACTLSHQAFPYADIWPYLSRIFEAYGVERCMWGTDWTRAVEFLTYEQGVEAFLLTKQLSDSQRSTLMGGSLAQIYQWSPTDS